MSKKAPHPGLAAAIAMAGGVTELAKICGCNHGSIIYLRDSGKPLKEAWAVRAAVSLGISAAKLMTPAQ